MLRLKYRLAKRLFGSDAARQHADCIKPNTQIELPVSQDRSEVQNLRSSSRVLLFVS